MSQITLQKGRCCGDILRKHVNIILPVYRILRVTRIIDFDGAYTSRANELFFLRQFLLIKFCNFLHNSRQYKYPRPDFDWAEAVPIKNLG